MKTLKTLALTLLAAATLPVSSPVYAQRQMEKLDRGVVAVRTGSSTAFVSWRLLGLDPDSIQFNLYRSSSGGAWVKLNSSPLSGGCNFSDTGINFAGSNAYRVAPVLNGEEQAPSSEWILPANAEEGPMFRIPLQAPHDRAVHHVWVGDADGDGEYEFYASLIGLTAGQSQKLAAYKRDGTFLWDVDFGPNSVDPNNIYPNASAIAAGQWDGITVYDLDGDGRAEVLIKSANGVTFGDGVTLSYGDNITQFISVLDALTGSEKARIELPNPWKADNNYALGAQFGIGYPDGARPSLMVHAKNRTGGSGTPFNTINSAWDYRDSQLSKRWSIQFNGTDWGAPEASHQVRMIDVDGDGKDELVPGIHAIDNDGSLLWDLHDVGLVHGDRFHISDIDPNREGLECYGIQQRNPSGVVEYMVDAATGAIIWVNTVSPDVDAARGVVSDIDPTYAGYESWSFYGTHTATGTEILSGYPTYPNLQIWWDGDLLGESLNEEKLEKWNYQSQTVSRLVTAYHYGASAGARNAPAFYGDILGDWREEIVFENGNHAELIVFTTPNPTSERIYTLAHNPAYRNCMTVKGYIQENLPDYFLGSGMSTPPTPNIYLTGDTNAPAAATGLSISSDGAQAFLSWSTNSEPDLAGYRIYRSTVSGGPYTAVADLSENSYTDNALDNGTTYHYVVAAKDISSNIGPVSDEVSATGEPDLVAYYRMEGVVSDRSGNGNDAEATGTPAYAAGQIGQAVDLDGSDDLITLPPGRFNSSDITLATWVYWNGGDNWQRIFDFGADTTKYLFLTPSGGDSNSLRFAIKNGGDEQIVETTQLATGQWVHLAVTLGGDTATLYVNGTPAANNTGVTIDPIDLAPSHNYIGNSQWPDPLFNGKIDEFMVYNYALSGPAVADLAAGIDTMPPLPPTGLSASSSASSISLNWNNNPDPDIASYSVYRSSSTNGTPGLIASGLTTSAYTDNSVALGTTYSYTVIATDTSANPSAHSAEATADITPPAAPTGLTATTTDSSVCLNWANNTEPDLASYNVYRASSSSGRYRRIATAVETNTYTDTLVALDTDYYYVITASDAYSNKSDDSAELCATPKTVIVPQANPLAYYRFEENTPGTAVPVGGNQVVDSAGSDDNMNAGATTTAPQYSGILPVSVIAQTGEANTHSTYYDGGDGLDNAITGPLVSTVYSNITVEAYVRFSSLSGFQTIVGRDDTSGNTSGGVDGKLQALFYLSKHNDGHFRVEVSNADGDLVAVEGSVNPAQDTWYHIAAVGDAAAGTLTLYVDAQNVGSATGFNGLYPTTTHPWTLGRGMYDGAPVDRVTGYIDEIRITDDALSTNQFLCTFNADRDGDGLDDAWEMDQFGSLNQSGSDDPDVDGHDNETEETHGTPPTISSTPPHINILVNQDTMSINWPSNHTGWRLEYTTNLIGGLWLEIPNSHTNNCYNCQGEAPDGDHVYYRLTYP